MTTVRVALGARSYDAMAAGADSTFLISAVVRLHLLRHLNLQRNLLSNLAQFGDGILPPCLGRGGGVAP